MIEGSECQSVRDSDVLCIHEKCKLIWNYWHVEKPKWKIKHTFNRISKTCSVSKCYEWNITKWNKLALYCQLWSYIYFAIGFFKFLQSRYVSITITCYVHFDSIILKSKQGLSSFQNTKHNSFFNWEQNSWFVF